MVPFLSWNEKVGSAPASVWGDTYNNYPLLSKKCFTLRASTDHNLCPIPYISNLNLVSLLLNKLYICFYVVLLSPCITSVSS